MAILARDDLIPLMESYGITTIITDLAEQNASSSRAISVLEWEMSQAGIFLEGLSESRLEHLVADLLLAGKLTGTEIWLGSNVAGTARAAAPSSIGKNSESVWVTPPGDGLVLRFYTNGELKKTQTVTNLGGDSWDGHSVALATIEAITGDTVQVAQVVDGVVGWWSKITI